MIKNILVALALTYGACIAAESQIPPLSPMDAFELKHVSTPEISPDGHWIVYVRECFDVMTDQRYSNLWLIRTDGTGHRPLTTGHVRDSSPKWSPDGKRIAYLSTRDGPPQIYVHWIGSGQSLQVTSGIGVPRSILWSPNGRLISFLKRVGAPPLTVGPPLNPPPGAQWVPPPKYTDKLVFRIDQIGELPPGYTHLFVVPADGGIARQVTSGNYHHDGAIFSGRGYSWAPDGKAIVLTARRRADAESLLVESDLFEVAVTDGALRQLTDRFGPDSSPEVSPNGKLIAYTGFDDRKQGYQNTSLYVMNRDGSGKRVLSSKIDSSIGPLAWTSDSRSVFAIYDERGITYLAQIKLDGTFRVVGRDIGSGYFAYGWNPFFSVARDDTLAFAISTPSIAGDVAVARPGAARKILTALNADIFAARALGEVEEFWWSSAKDGRRVQGWIVKPPGFEPSRKYPLILEIHGGPFANYGPRFDLEKQLMAAAGYVVLYTNPRGSTSYGEEFANLIHHAYPGDDADDLDAGVDALVAKGYIDEQNLFITGGSGGGVLTAWMTGRTNRFKAAVAFYPVINWQSWALTADTGVMGVNNWFPGLPWDHVEQYQRRSPLSVLKNVKTPTLIMTGEDDFRTPISESEQYFKALKMLGVDTVLVRVPGEGHGIWRRPSNGLRKITTLQGWFAKYQTPSSIAPSLQAPAHNPGDSK